jgi:hypothetical protein
MATRRNMLLSTVMGLVASRLPAWAQSSPKPADTEWRHYGGDLANRRYAPLHQINAGNFGDLEVAWRFKPDMLGSRPEYQFESTPLVIKGRLFTTAGSRRDVVALDAKNGELLWLHRYEEGERGATAPASFPAMAYLIGRTARRNASSMSRPAIALSRWTPKPASASKVSASAALSICARMTIRTWTWCIPISGCIPPRSSARM